MSAKEFIKLAISSGYAGKKQAEEYVKTAKKTEFTDDDFVEVYRFANERPVSKNYASKRSILSEDEDPNSVI